MSINAIEVLEERLKKRERVAYHAVDWTRGSWSPEEYPPPVDLDGYEVTPATGVNLVG